MNAVLGALSPSPSGCSALISSRKTGHSGDPPLMFSNAALSLRQPHQHKASKMHHTSSNRMKLQASSQPQQETFMDVMSNIFNAISSQPAAPTGAFVNIQGVSYQPPGAPTELLTDINFQLPPNELGIVFGRSGSGKTTLLQIIAGLAQQNSGIISFSGPNGAGLPMQQRMASAGLVFQFPERHFVGSTLADELTAGWPTTPQALVRRQQLTTRTYEVLSAVGLQSLPLDIPLSQLSDGYKRRVALAVQLVRRPAVLLLDEPLAGLDWRTRSELVRLLAALKKECSVLVVSHDLRELAPLVDKSWKMLPGGKLIQHSLPL